MNYSCFTGDSAPANTQIATGYSARGNPRTALEHPYREYGFQYQGMGGAVSNVWDLLRWDQALSKKKVLSSKATKALFKPGPGGYALGWKIDEKGSVLRQSHGGSVRGFVCEIRRLPKKKAFIAVLCNDDDFMPSTVSQIIEDALLKGEVMDIPKGLDKETQAKFVGSYKTAKGHKMEIAAKGESTMVKIYWPQGYRSFGTMGMNEDKDLVFLPLFDPSISKVKFNDDGLADSIDLGYGPYRRE